MPRDITCLSNRELRYWIDEPNTKPKLRHAMQRELLRRWDSTQVQQTKPTTDK